MTASSAHLVRDGPLDTNSCFVEERSSGLSPLQTANHFRPPRASTPASKGWRFLKSIGHFSGKRRASSRDELFQDKHSDGGYGQDSDAIDSGHRTSSLFGTASSLEEGDRSTDCLRQASSNDDSNLRLAQVSNPKWQCTIAHLIYRGESNGSWMLGRRVGAHERRIPSYS